MTDENLANRLIEAHNKLEVPEDLFNEADELIDNSEMEVLDLQSRIALKHRVSKAREIAKVDGTEALNELQEAMQERDQRYFVSIGIAQDEGETTLDPTKEIKMILQDYLRAGLEYTKTYKQAQAEQPEE